MPNAVIVFLGNYALHIAGSYLNSALDWLVLMQR